MTLADRAAALEASDLIAWYHTMVTIRLAEDKVMEIYMSGLVPGTVHLAQGQEAVSVGAIGALSDQDYILCTYRGHHHALARGMDLRRFFAEIMGRVTGSCAGMGGSSHVIDFAKGMLGSPAIIGAGIPVAVGAALAAKFRNEDRIALAFFGDGACNIGAFHEALNMAQLWNAPAVFVIENNQYGEYTPYRDVTALVGEIADRAKSYGMANEVVDGQDVTAVFEVVVAARHRATSGGGPTLIEAKTYRYRGHSRTDPGKYRPPGELEAWKKRDPISILGEALATEGALSREEQEAIWETVQEDIDRAAANAAEDPWPTFEQAESYVFAP